MLGFHNEYSRIIQTSEIFYAIRVNDNLVGICKDVHHADKLLKLISQDIIYKLKLNTPSSTFRVFCEYSDQQARITSTDINALRTYDKLESIVQYEIVRGIEPTMETYLEEKY